MRGRHEHGFTLIELLVTMAITTIILGATFGVMTNAIRATESAGQISSMNNGLRTAMDVMVRDLLQVGQGLPSGRNISIPNGTNSVTMRIPSAPGTNYVLDGAAYCPPRADDPDTVCEEIAAIIPGPGRGPVVVAGQPATDTITTLAADSSFDSVPLVAFAADGRSIRVALPGTTVVNGSFPQPHPSGHNITDDPDIGGDNINPGDLLMLTKGSASTLVEVSSVAGQQVTFADNDALRLNQQTAAAGTATLLRATAPIDALTRPTPCGAAPAPCDFVTTVATKIRMISYYIDNTTDATRPRLVRRINNGSWNTFNNATGGTVVAFDVEDLKITYDLVDGVGNPSGVRMTDVDMTIKGRCAPASCYPNQIRKVNLTLAVRSRQPRRGTKQLFRNKLTTQVSLRGLAFVDKYR